MIDPNMRKIAQKYNCDKKFVEYVMQDNKRANCRKCSSTNLR